MKQTKYSDEEKFKIIAEARSSGNIAATAKRYSIEVILFTFGMKRGCRRKEIP